MARAAMSFGHHAVHHMALKSRDRAGSGDSAEADNQVAAGQR